MIKVRSLYYILLMLFPIASFDFLPPQLILVLCLLLLVRVFTHLNKYLIILLATSSIFYLRSLYGNTIIPESMISFLAFMILSRMLSQDNGDYKVNRFLGFLWAGTFILFRTDLASIFILLFTIFFILKTIQYDDNEKIQLRTLFTISNINFKELVAGSIIVILLFIFFPRVYNFLPSARAIPIGKVGYSQEINNSDYKSLTPSSQTAFFAQMIQIPRNDLYWRGRVLVNTDGYNWRSKNLTSRSRNTSNFRDQIQYQIKYEQDFKGDLILLDTPTKVLDSNIGNIKNNEFQTFTFYNKNKKAYVKAKSILSYDQFLVDKNNLKNYLQLPEQTKVTLSKFVNNFKNHRDLNDLIFQFQNYIKNNEFYYTLSPKGSETLKGFLKNKQGFCTHYASLLGITLRYFKYPTRLISGFQGGIYNEIGGIYKVSSNDAHAWVEVFNGKTWLRIDPTAFIAPNRVLEGGEAFLTGTSLQRQKNNFFSKWFYKTRQHWDNLNYKVNLFLDTYDQEEQRNLAKDFKLKRWIFILIGFFITGIILLYLYLSKKQHRVSKSEVDRIFEVYTNKLSKNDIDILSTDNLNEIKKKILQAQLHENFSIFLNYYEQAKYSQNKNIAKLKDLLKDIK